MLIIGLNGSPIPNGNTKFLLEETLQKINNLGVNTEILDIAQLLNSAKHAFCTVCTSPCAAVCYKGTALEEALNLLKKADGIIVGSPVYFGSITGQTKAFFDKTRQLRAEKSLCNTVGAGLTVGNAKYGGQQLAIRALHDIMLVHGMIIVGDGYREDDCGYHGVSAQRPAQEDSYALKRTGILAKRMVEVCEATACLRR
ncbi:MAG: flavodoxin family protein [Peptococcaceae bacterium]|jgi:multimeric flavodoxin WrbA|nr:flavodoxin family protein [Peptococcaceae bacterium]